MSFFRSFLSNKQLEIKRKLASDQKMEKKVVSDCVVKTTEAKQQTEGTTPDRVQEPLLIHGLSVDRYREIYNSVLTPAALSKLAESSNADYVSSVMELKQKLWNALSRPRLQERVMEDGRVEVTEIFDLT